MDGWITRFHDALKLDIQRSAISFVTLVPDSVLKNNGNVTKY